jgi:CheY-like chemotaxis protein
VARIVLVADDSPTIQKKALGILKGEGFEVETVSNGVAAIKRLAVLHPVVILADVSMPGRDGYEVCDFVKKSAELSHVPVLLVASDMEPYDDARGAQVKADGIIKKPFEPQELISIVMKFAEECEAAAARVSAPVAPPPAPEPAQDFSAFNELPEETPTVVQHVAPDFSAVSEGVAFAEPAAEEAPGFSMEPPPAELEGQYAAPQTEAEIVAEPAPAPAEMEMPYPAPQAEAEIALEPAPAPEFVDTVPAPEVESSPAEEPPLAVEEPPAPAPPPEERAPSFLERLEAATPEPVFIEEQTAPASEPMSSPAEVRTMIFRAPLEIAEPVWKDETVPAPPAPESAGPTALEPQVEPSVASPETSVEQPPAPPHFAPSVTATSLDSFSLDDATAGQVHFASEASEVAPVEVAHSAPAEEAAATEIAPPEPAPEAASPEIAPPEAPPEAAPPEPPAEGAAPPPPFDWGLIYTVVHKVVVKMSPPALPMEAMEEMARRLADEIAMEISSESHESRA